MLVLTRKRMEKLYIGGDICVTVVRLEGGQVRLGIEAPRDVPVVRAELRERDRAAAAAFARLAEIPEPPPALESIAPTPWPVRSAPLADRTRGGREPATVPVPLQAKAQAQDCATRSGSLKR